MSLSLKDQDPSLPKFYKSWILPKTTGHQALVLDQQAMPDSLGDDEVLVEIRAASLNYRELVVAKVLLPCITTSRKDAD